MIMLNLLPVAFLALLAAPAASDDNGTMKQKCDKLDDPRLRKAFINGTCYVLTAEPTTEGYNTWRNMGKFCNHLPENRGRMATITTQQELDELYRQGILANDIVAYIGALQDPSDAGLCGNNKRCGADIHARNWWFIDEHGNKLVEVNPDLWKTNTTAQPDNNMFGSQHENAVAIERRPTGLEIHDYNPITDHYKVLCQYQDDNTLKQKCEQLSPSLRKAFIGSSCFVVTADPSIEGYNTWRNMRKHCSHLPGFRGRMATLTSKKQLDELARLNIVKESEDLFIGAIQEPSDAGTCKGGQPCGPEIHKNNWWFIDENGKRLTMVDASLWRSVGGEPNNLDKYVSPTPHENAVSLSRNQSSVGFNDVNPMFYQLKVLCQYGNK